MTKSLLSCDNTVLSFLRDLYGYDEIERTRGIWEFRSHQISLRIICDYSRDYGVGVTINPLNYPVRAFELYHFEQFYGFLQDGESFPESAATQDELDSAIRFFTRYMKNYCQDLLIAEEQLMIDLEERIATLDKEYNLDIQLRSMRVRANRAWDAKEFEKVFEIYKEFLPHLSDSEKFKCEYAKNRLG